jgi:hypothetical protein
VFIEADVVVSGVVCLLLLCTFLFCVLDLYLGTAVGYSFVVIVAVVRAPGPGLPCFSLWSASVPMFAGRKLVSPFVELSPVDSSIIFLDLFIS